MINTKPVSVEINHAEKGFVTLSPVWFGVDRPVTGGISVPVTMVDRVKRAILDGVAYPFEKVATDVNGKTYVVTGMAIMGRRLVQDLKKLGY